MPKRVIDFDALWASDKLASCAEWAQSEYAWLYGLADASGSFEITNLRVIWGRVAAIRKNLSLERLREIFDEFIARGLLFTWEENGKRYAHWTGSDVPGRLPAPSWRVRLEKLAPPVPTEALAAYSARFGGSKEGIVLRAHRPGTGDLFGACERGSHARGAHCEPRIADANAGSRDRESGEARAAGLNHGLEEAQGQDLDLGLDSEKDLENQVCLPPQRMQNRRGPADSDAEPRFSEATSGGAPEVSAAEQVVERAVERAAEELLEIYERERGELPAAGVLTAERRRKCARWLAGGFTPEEFRAAVRSAAATPFLAGEGNRGWQATFDWLIANRTNARKVLEGEYAPHLSRLPRSSFGPQDKSGQVGASAPAHAIKPRAERRVPADLYTGIGPRAADCGVRVNPAALERIRARYAQEGRFSAPPEVAPKPVAFDAQARASPSPLKS